MIYTLRNRDGLQVVVHRLVAFEEYVYYLSMGGSREEVEALWGSLASGEEVHLEGHGPLRGIYGGLRYRRAQLGPIVHGLVVSVPVAEGTILLYGTPLEAAKGLSRVLGLPVFPEWVPFVEEALEERTRYLDPLILGVKALYLPPYIRAGLRERIQEALRGKILPLSEEARWRRSA